MNPRRLAPELTIIHYKAGWLVRRPGRGQICMSARLPSPTVPPVNPGFYHAGAGSDPRRARAISQPANERRVAVGGDLCLFGTREN